VEPSERDDIRLTEDRKGRRVEHSAVLAVPGDAVPGQDSRDVDHVAGIVPEAVPPPRRSHPRLERFLEEHALRWIDEAVPALGELTPRAACATPEGRRRVGRLMRARIRADKVARLSEADARREPVRVVRG
jgi:hypothetical protein